MSNQTPEEIVRDPKNRIVLTERDQFALDRWLRSKQPPVAPDTATRMLELYLRGHDCEDIRKANPGFSLGSIIHARVVWRWDLAIDEYREKLRAGVIDKATIVGLETVHVVSDLLSANNRRLKQKLLCYFQSGNDADLPIEVSSVRELKGLVEVWQMLTGQKAPTRVEHTHTVDAPATPQQVEARAEDEERAHSEILAMLTGETAPPKGGLKEMVAGNPATAGLLDVPGVSEALEEAEKDVEKLAKDTVGKVLGKAGVRRNEKKN